ncbi:MAG TPA: 7,8-didemethyl-8-hydroxy-5-deazariboflavin synthase CofG [Nitrososphaeraceae archaeon]
MNGSKYAKNEVKMRYDNTQSYTSVNEILAKTLERESISKTEAYELINYNENDLIVPLARTIRDRNNKSRVITYSRKVFINLINLCKDTCSYCTYKKEPYERLASMMTPSQVLTIAELGKKFRCTEALFVTGERPEQKYFEARDWLRSVGHTSTVEYIVDMSEKVLQKTGLLPHTNAGSLTKKEMCLLKDTNISLGMMLESTSERLIGKGMPHEKAPSKNPKVRIKTLEDAGKLKIPFTTGLLIGIGEEPEELIDSLFVIKEMHRKYGHIQEVIIQNFMPKLDTEMAKVAPAKQDYFIKVVALARIILQDINIQVPPNLNPNIFERFLDAGINDWGGVSPITIDYVNPEFPWPTIESLKNITSSKGFLLRARLPIYPEFLLHKGDSFVSDKLMTHINSICDASGLVREDFVN